MTNNLNGWVFTYNSFTHKWLATTRDHYAQLFNGGPDVLKSNSIDTLQEIIIKTGGDKEKLEKLVKSPEDRLSYSRYNEEG